MGYKIVKLDAQGTFEIIETDETGADVFDTYEEAEIYQDDLDFAEIDNSLTIETAEAENSDISYNIWDLAVDAKPSFYDPRGLDYKTALTTSLFASLHFVKGELLSVQYYSDYDGAEYTGLILDVAVTYNRSEGVLTDRQTVRKWTIESDQDEDVFGPHVKTTKKYYTITQAAVADQRRRSNIVDNLVAKAHPSVASFVKTMFRNLDNEINSFKSTGDTRLLEKIQTYDGQWLEAPVAPSVTLRMAILGALSL